VFLTPILRYFIKRKMLLCPNCAQKHQEASCKKVALFLLFCLTYRAYISSVIELCLRPNILETHKISSLLAKGLLVLDDVIKKILNK